MPAAGRKRVEGGLPILSQSVAIGRNRSRLVAPKQKTRRRKSRVSAYRSQSVAIGRVSAYRSPAGTEDKAPKKSRFGVPVAIGRDWSRFGVPVASRNRRQGAEKVAFRRTGRNRSQSVAIGRNRSPAETEDKAPKKSRFGVPVAIGRDWSRLVAIGRDWSRRNRRQGAEKVAIGRNRSPAETEDKAQTQKKPDSTIGNQAA